MKSLVLAGLLVLAWWLPARAEAPLGRLFHTPEERAQLDRQRRLGLDPSRAGADGTLRFDGLVRRGDGKTTVWVNGQRLEAGGRLLTGDGRLVVRSGGHDAALRVGESLGGMPSESPANAPARHEAQH